MKKFFSAAFLFALIAYAMAQTFPGQFPANSIYGNATGSIANPVPLTTTQVNALLSPAVNPVTYGADPTGANDSATALNNALAASNYIVFPPGTYKFLSAISYSIPAGVKSVTIVGGGQDATILNWPNASGGITFTYAGIGSSAHIRDLSFTTGTTNGGTALTLNYATSNANPALTAISDLYRVTIRGSDGYGLTNYWTTGVNVANVSNVQISDLTVIGSSTFLGTGLSLIGLPGSATFGVEYNVSLSNFNNLATGINYGNYVQGVTVDATNFTGTKNGIVTAASLTGLAQLSVSNSQFSTLGTTSGNAIITNTAITGLSLTNNLFLVNGTTPTGIGLSLASATTISNNVFWNSSGATAGAVGLNIQNNTTSCAITGNSFEGFSGTGAFGLVLGASAGACNVSNNSFHNNTTHISNSGAGNFIVNNPGYNPVGTTAAATMGASPFTITAGASPETHYINQSATNTASWTKNTRLIGNANNALIYYVVELGPNESYVVTWATTAPTYVKDVH
jgi:hypothetical protein